MVNLNILATNHDCFCCDECFDCYQTSQDAQSFASEVEFAEWLNANPMLYKGGGAWSDYAGFSNDIDEIAVYVSIPRHIDQVESLARYFLEGEFRAECYGVKSPDLVEGWGQLFIISTDTTKSLHDDWSSYMDHLWLLLRDGSDIRKTNKMGPGTQGTRAVEGLGCEIWVAVR